MIVNDTWFDDRDAGLTYLGNGRMLLTYFHNDAEIYTGQFRNLISNEADDRARGAVMAILDSYSLLPKEEAVEGSFVKISNNMGMNWSDPIEVPISAPHGPVLTNSGRLLYFGKNLAENAIDLYESFDLGESWQFISKVPSLGEGHPGQVYEPHLAELPSGVLVGAIRVEIISPGKKELTIYMTYSEDGGKTWSVPAPTGICGTPPHLLLLRDGNLLLSYGRRDEPRGSRARISVDGGKTFGEEYIISNSPHYDIGYPSTVELDDGTLITVHYQAWEDDDKTSILYTKWTR